MLYIKNFTKVKIPHGAWSKLYLRKSSVRHKEISVAVVGDKRMRQICKRRYKKPNTTVLTFKYDHGHGEIVLNVFAARKTAQKTKTSLSKVLTEWFVHGLSRFI